MRRSIYQTLRQKRVQLSPIDRLINTAAAAYSIRQLTSSYAGKALKIRRAGDNAQQDIGFVNGQLDETAILVFCAGSSAFVSVWYDQSGKNLHAVNGNVSTQPQIVSNGSIIKYNGKSAIRFFLANSSLIAPPAMPNCNEFSLLVVHNEINRVQSIPWCLARDVNIRSQSHAPWTDGNIYFDINLTPPTYSDRRVSTLQVASVGQLKLIEFIHSVSGNRLAIRENNIDRASTIASATTVFSGQTAMGDNPIAPGGFDGTFSEFILFDRDLSASDRSLITLGIKSQYLL